MSWLLGQDFAAWGQLSRSPWKVIKCQSSKAHASSKRLELGSNSLRMGSGFFENGVLMRNSRQKLPAPETLSMIRFDGQKELAHRSSYREEIQSRYGEPIWCLHRIHLQRALATRAEKLGVRLVFNSLVRDVDFDRPSQPTDCGHLR